MYLVIIAKDLTVGANGYFAVGTVESNSVLALPINTMQALEGLKFAPHLMNDRVYHYDSVEHGSVSTSILLTSSTPQNLLEGIASQTLRNSYLKFHPEPFRDVVNRVAQRGLGYEWDELGCQSFLIPFCPGPQQSICKPSSIRGH